MSFLTTTKIVSKRIRPGDFRPYFFELFLVVFLFAFWLGYSDLAAIRRHDAIATAGPSDFILMATPGIYGIRVSMFIAMARRYRMPQVLEWLAFIVPMAVFVVCAAASGHFAKAYAGAHGYRFCGGQGERSTTYVFATGTCNAVSTPPK